MNLGSVAFSMDHERRFGGLRRLYGIDGAQRIFNAHVVVVGVGGVGSWVAESLARSGVGRLTLIDMDHIAESNINRQIHAVDLSLGMSKVDAMRQRILSFHPQAEVIGVDDFVTPDNVNLLLPSTCDAVIDACDQVSAKFALLEWARTRPCDLITVGAAGGKRVAHLVELDDLVNVTHDPLLAQLRYRVRKRYPQFKQSGKKMGVPCVFSREAVARPEACESQNLDGSLNCHGYGSVVAVTAVFGMAAAGWVLERLASKR